MTVIGITSSRTSPGATSLATGLALALSAEHERTLLVEADPAGGVLSLRFGLEVTPSLTTFGSDTRNGYAHDLVWKNTQDLRGAQCMAAPVDPRLASSWVERVTPDLVAHLPTLGAPTIIDLGWISDGGPSLGLAAASDVVLVVTRPEIAEVQALLFQVRQLQSVGATVGLVTIGTEPNDPQEVAAVAGIPLVAVLPDDAKVAAALRGAKFAPNKFRRSLLWRSIGGIATTLVDPAAMFARAVGVTGPDDAISIETFGAPDPTEYAELAPEALEGEQVPVYDPQAYDAQAPVYDPRTYSAPEPAVPETSAPAPAAAAPATEAPLYETPAYEAPGYEAPAPAASIYHVPVSVPVTQDQRDQPAPTSQRPSFSDRYGSALDEAATRREQVHTDPDAGQRIAEELDLAHAVDIDLTIDPDLFDVTNQLREQPGGELIDADGERVLLSNTEPTFIGRHSGCEIVLRDSQVSRQHGRLTRTVTGWHYADLGSRNGSVLNGRPCTEAFLTPGDELYVGSARFVFQTVPTREMESA